MRIKTGLCTTICSSFIFIAIFFIYNAWAQSPAGMNEEAIKSVEERRILVSLQEERDKLQKREKLLASKEMELKSLRREVDKKLNELRFLKEEVQKLLAIKDDEEAKKIRALGKVYEKMDPAKAASIIPFLKKELAIGILASMKKKSAAKVLNSMDKEKALILSRAFLTLGQK